MAPIKIVSELVKISRYLFTRKSQIFIFAFISQRYLFSFWAGLITFTYIYVQFFNIHLSIIFLSTCRFSERSHFLIYLNINQHDALNFIMSLFHAATCLSTCAHRQEVKIVLYNLWYHHTETSVWSKVTFFSVMIPEAV